MFSIEKTVTFHAAHRLPQMEEGHQCRNLHGHTYKVTMKLSSAAVGGDGIMVDFGELSKVVKQYDHTFLGSGTVVVDGVEVKSMLGDLPATAEMLAAAIGHQLVAMLDAGNADLPEEMYTRLDEVEVWETETSVVRFTPR